MMDKIGFVEISITGSKGNLDLSPDNYDIREIVAFLQNAEQLLFPSDKRDRPTITYAMEAGSVKHFLKTTIQTIIGFNAIIGQVRRSQSIDFLDVGTAKAIESMQEIAAKRDYIFNIKTSLENTFELKMDKTTRFFRSETLWADAEFYFYGRVTNAGGKDKANIHITTEEFGTLRIHTPISFLEAYHENLLYKTLGIRATGKQHSETGELDTSTLRFVDLVDYQPKYEELYLKSLRNKAKESWLGKIDAVEWLNEMRGGYET
jgi:hypothetical protein